jgi:signal transduction histidine kinase
MKTDLRFWRRSLVARLVFYFLLLELGTVALLGMISYVRSRIELERSGLERLEVTAALQADALVRWADTQQREFLFFAEIAPIRDQMQELLGYTARNSTAAGPHPAFDAARTELSKLFLATAAGKSEWQEILLLSAKSEILVSTEPNHEGDHRILDSYFIQGKRGAHVERVYPSPLTYTPTMTFSTPLKGDEPGEEDPGVLAVHLDLAWLDKILFAGTSLGERSVSYLVDPVNVLLSGKRFGHAGSRRGVRSQGIDEALAGRPGAGLYLDYNGVQVLGVYRFIQEIGVALAVEIPLEVVLAPAHSLLRVLAAAGSAIAVLLAAATFLLANQIARPILAIRDAAQEVTQGTLKARAPVLTSDEVGTLAGAFNHMLEEMAAKTAELERFTYTVSHDLKSPLVTIRGFLGYLAKDIAAGDQERVASDLERIRGATATMQQLLDELLELSRIGRVMNRAETVPLTEVVEQALATTAGHLTQHQIQVTVDLKDTDVVHGDRVRLQEVFQNLIDNAARFMGEEPEPRIEIGAEPQGDNLLCHVRDNGIGIDPRYHDLVFGLFERLDADIEGTGIGLALVKRIVEVHHGRIWIESQGAGHGSTFFLTLPAVTSQ